MSHSYRLPANTDLSLKSKAFGSVAGASLAMDGEGLDQRAESVISWHQVLYKLVKVLLENGPMPEIIVKFW